MKKTLKRLLASFFAFALLISGLGMQSMEVRADEGYTAFLMFSDRDWAFGNWDSSLESATTKVTGDGSYSVTLNATEVGGDGATGANGAQVFCVDIVGAQAGLDANGKTFEVSNVSVLADGKEVAVDASKIAAGDIEENGNFRIEIYNEYGLTVGDAPIDPMAFTFAENVTVNFTLTTVDKPANEAAAVAVDNTAFLMFSDRDWAFGNWDAALESATTQVTGDGTYSVTLNATEVGGDGTTGANGAQVFCVDIVGAQAVLDAQGKTFEVSDVSILADGKEVAVDASKIATGDIEENGNFRIEIYNEYGLTVGDAPIDPMAFTFADNVTVNFTLTTVNKVVESTAFLMFSDRDWAFGNWDAALESATTTVAGDGTYTVTLNAAEVGGDGSTGANGAQVFCVDVVGLGAAVEDVSAITVSDVKVLADGAEFAIDPSKIAIGDIEENGNFRIELYNEYGLTVGDAPFDPTTLTFKDTLSVTFTLGGIVYGASEAAAEEVPVNEFDPNGTYHAYIGVQTPTWIFRNWYGDESYGLGTGCYDQLGFIDGEWIAQGGSFKDVEITGNGTYTVAVEGYDFSGTFEDQPILGADGLFNLLFVSTDLPVNDEVVISNVVLKMDGKEITTIEEAFLDPDSKEVQSVLLANIWNNELADLPYYAAPKQSIEISFDVSGFANDAVVEEPVATEAPAEPTEAPVATEAPVVAEPEEKGSVVPVVVGVIVVAAAAGAGVFVAKKKKAGTTTDTEEK